MNSLNLRTHPPLPNAIYLQRSLTRVSPNNSSGGSVSAYSISGSAVTQVYAAFFRHVPQEGQIPARQEASHPHEAVLDPTGGFLVVPDLGADLVRVWNVDQKTLELSASAPLNAPTGSGPRHVAFLKTASKTFMYLISELANTVTAYLVTYKCDGSLGFTEVFRTNTHGDNSTLPSTVTAAEIHLSVSPTKSFPHIRIDHRAPC